MTEDGKQKTEALTRWGLRLPTSDLIRVTSHPPISLLPSMSYRCEICGKEPGYGKTVSFSHKRNNRRWLPNIQRVRVTHGSNTRRARVCTSCIRAGKVQKG